MKIALLHRLMLLVFAILVLSYPLNAVENAPSSNIFVRPTLELEPITPDNVHRLERVGVIGTGNVNGSGAAWSPDGTVLAVPSSLGIWLYDARDWSHEPRYILNEAWSVYYLAYSADGRFLIATTPQGLEFRLVAEDYRVVQAFPMNLADWMRIVVSPDSRFLVMPSGRDFRETMLWRIDYGDPIMLTQIAGYEPALPGETLNPVFSADSRRLLILREGTVVMMVETETGMRVENDLNTGETAVEAVTFSSDGELMAYASENRVHIMETATGNPVQQLEMAALFSPSYEKRRIYDIAFMPGSSQILVLQVGAIADENRYLNTPTLWDARSGELIRQYAPVIGRRILISPDTAAFLSGDLANYDVTRTAEQDRVVYVSWSLFEINELEVSPENDLLYGYDFEYHPPINGELLNWQHRTYTPVPGYGVISEDSEWLFILNERPNHVAVLYQPEMVITRTIGHNGDISSIDTRPQTPQFATATITTRAGEGGAIRIFDWRDETFLDVLPDQGGAIAEIEYNTDGTLLASQHVCQVYPAYYKYPCSSEHIGIYLWNAETYRLPVKIDIHLSDASGGIAFTPDGQALLIPDCEPLAGQGFCEQDSLQKYMRLVNMATLNTLYTISHAIAQPVFSPDGSLLAGVIRDASHDGQFMVWNGKTGDLLATVPAHRFSVADVAFSPDGYFIYSGSRASGNDGEYNVIWVWGVPATP